MFGNDIKVKYLGSRALTTSFISINLCSQFWNTPLSVSSSERKFSQGYNCFSVCLFSCYFIAKDFLQNGRYLVNTIQCIFLLMNNLKGWVWEKWKLNSSDRDRFANSEHNSNFIDAFKLQYRIPGHVHVNFIAFYSFRVTANVCLRITMVIQDEQEECFTRKSRTFWSILPGTCFYF